MNNTDWKQIGWKITRKLVYYAIVVFVLCFLVGIASSLMTIASTTCFCLGLLLMALTLGIGFTVVIREILYYCSKF